jgi:hypothetical protein
MPVMGKSYQMGIDERNYQFKSSVSILNNQLQPWFSEEDQSVASTTEKMPSTLFPVATDQDTAYPSLNNY